MITTYSFNLYGKLLKTDTSKEIVEAGHNLPMLAATIQKGMFIELEIENKLWLGTVNEVTRFPPDADGDRVVHVFIYGLAPKYREGE